MHVQADSVREAEERALRDAAASQQEIKDEVAQSEAVAAEAERSVQRAEQDMQAVKAQTAQLQAEVKHLTATVAEARYNLITSSSFSSPSLQAKAHGQHTAPAAAEAPAAAPVSPTTSGG
jgi:septal ring factor EnvC (AmiA/AmiB activator)